MPTNPPKCSRPCESARSSSAAIKCALVRCVPDRDDWPPKLKAYVLRNAPGRMTPDMSVAQIRRVLVDMYDEYKSGRMSPKE